MEYATLLHAVSEVWDWSGVFRCIKVWESCPLVAPYYCRLGDLLCFVFMSAYCMFWFICVLFVPSVLWYCWLGLLTCKNRLPSNLYCVGGDVKNYSIQSIRCIKDMSALLCRTPAGQSLGKHWARVWWRISLPRVISWICDLFMICQTNWHAIMTVTSRILLF